ncbi:glycosyltransferase family 4 protein [Lactococcus lactis]|uniref:glycosyltransferase family 4 protein n=1 Tax=Lactococcus lactis TaxID=1358 RepID=UPI00288E5CA9|nr:glycosyltransferase family 4 protein [Lactococcus lactis]MDT2866756.1 glycosyltransferase family 4 protein [Lactococcus lactis]
MTKITFVLPTNYNKPMGGFKIVYQYANWLIEQGFKVSICYCYGSNESKSYAAIKRLVDTRIIKFSRRETKVTWFALNKSIELVYNCIFSQEFPDSDIIFATSARTAPVVSSLPKEKGRKFYFIQGYESIGFGNKEGFAEETYNLGMTNIVISNELRQKVLSSGVEVPEYLPNFYNHNEFYLENPIEKRKNIVCLLNHVQETKRTKLGLEILREVKKTIPDLEVQLFGAYDPVEKLEDWIHFTKNANTEKLRKDIYGESKIYLLPSILEGWGLTGMEAMASGAAVVASRIGGIMDYANQENSILVTPDDKETFITEIINILQNEEKQLKIAKRGNEDIKQYSIEKSGKQLLQIINSKV